MLKGIVNRWISFTTLKDEFLFGWMVSRKSHFVFHATDSLRFLLCKIRCFSETDIPWNTRFRLYWSYLSTHSPVLCLDIPGTIVSIARCSDGKLSSAWHWQVHWLHHIFLSICKMKTSHQSLIRDRWCYRFSKTQLWRVWMQWKSIMIQTQWFALQRSFSWNSILLPSTRSQVNGVLFRKKLGLSHGDMKESSI